jgi:hypothetical protein
MSNRDAVGNKPWNDAEASAASDFYAGKLNFKALSF